MIRLGADALGETTCRPRRTLRRSRSGVETPERRHDELADRVEVVAALLDDHRRQAERAEQRAGRAVAVGGDRAAGSPGRRRGVDAERDDERRGAAVARPLAERRRPRSSQSLVAGARARAGGCGWRPRRRRRRARPRSPRKCGNQPGAGVDVDRAGQDAGVARRRSTACRCRGGRRCRSPPPGRPRARAARRGRGRGVVEVAGAAERRRGWRGGPAGGSRRRRRARRRATRSRGGERDVGGRRARPPRCPGRSGSSCRRRSARRGRRSRPGARGGSSPSRPGWAKR